MNLSSLAQESALRFTQEFYEPDGTRHGHRRADVSIRC